MNKMKKQRKKQEFRGNRDNAESRRMLQRRQNVLIEIKENVKSSKKSVIKKKKEQ